MESEATGQGEKDADVEKGKSALGEHTPANSGERKRELQHRNKHR